MKSKPNSYCESALTLHYDALSQGGAMYTKTHKGQDMETSDKIKSAKKNVYLTEPKINLL